MKRIYVIFFAAALSTAFFSCEKSSSGETTKERVEEVSDSIKDVIKDESHKTTKNGDDAH